MTGRGYILAAILWAAGGALALLMRPDWLAAVPFVCSAACVWAAYRLGRKPA